MLSITLNSERVHIPINQLICDQIEIISHRFHRTRKSRQSNPANKDSIVLKIDPIFVSSFHLRQ